MMCNALYDLYLSAYDKLKIMQMVSEHKHRCEFLNSKCTENEKDR